MSVWQAIDLYGLAAEKFAFLLTLFIRFSRNLHRRFIHPWQDAFEIRRSSIKSNQSGGG